MAALTAFSGDTMNQPRNASSLIAMRMSGDVPELPILASFVGPLNRFNNLALIAGKPADDYDWRALRGLEVEVIATQQVPFAHLVRHLAAIAAVVPKRMVLTFVEGPCIECGESRTVCDEHGDFMLFDWFPIAIAIIPTGYVGAQIVTRKLWAAIARGDIPTPFDRAMDLVVEIAKEKQQCA
jgi:hypothetical protein